MAIKQCKECGAEISSKAKVCPKCGYKLKRRGKGWTVLAVLAVLIGIIWSVSDGNKAVAESEETLQASVGEIVNTEKFELSVLSIALRDKVGSGFFESTPSEGGVYIAVQIKYKNITEEPISSFVTPSIKLINSKEIIYDPDLEASSSYASELEVDSKFLSDLNPGITVYEADVFEVSEEALKSAGWKIYIDADRDFYVPVSF